MSGIKMDILWSPNHSNKFITVGTEISLYQVNSFKSDESLKPNDIKLSDTSYATLLSVNTDNQYLKCISWYPKQEYDHLLAVGQATGKVVFTSLKQCSDPQSLIGREYVPRHSRQCFAVAWNPTESNLLSAGLDKHRTDSCILIWDINKTAGSHWNVESDRRSLPVLFESTNVFSKPLIEIGLSEIAHSFQWLAQQPKALIVGMNNKCIKMYDIRESARQTAVAHTKAVYGVCIDPLFEHRMSSYYEGQVMIWDFRNFEKPIHTLVEPKPISKIAWCPTRPNLLATIGRDSTHVKLYDVQHTCVNTDEVEPTVMERIVSCGDQHSISSFCWHSTCENRMATISSNNVIKDYTIFERITLHWLPSLNLVWSCGKKTIMYVDSADTENSTFDDISVKMKRRAISGYGLKTDHLWVNGSMVPDDKRLQAMWSMLDLMKSLFEENKLKDAPSSHPIFNGIHSIICGDNGTNIRSEAFNQSWSGLSGNVTSKVYRSSDRDKALLLCGWSLNRADDLFIDSLESDSLYQRAAAIAVFYLRIRRAIKSLNKGASVSTSEGGDVNLSAVAMALAGYTEDKNTLWREMCAVVRTQLQDPYLRALFAFLTSENDNFDEVLNEYGMSIQDRVAFACTFLPDNKLVNFLDQLTLKMIETGNLDGILLTGLTKEGLDLLQRYVDLTGDIQSASFVIVQALPGEIGSDPRVQQWIESYRELLDQWRLWHQRAQFDVLWCQFDSKWKAPQQVFISCNFCGKSIAALHAMGKTRPFMKLGNIANKSKVSRRARRVGVKGRKASHSGESGGDDPTDQITCCPGCRKPLPRCALCLVHLGTPSGTLSLKSDEKTDEARDQKISDISSWFTWCQTCRHGGHANHIAEWFKDHTECPVTACSCKCMALDSVSRVELNYGSNVKVN